MRCDAMRCDAMRCNAMQYLSSGKSTTHPSLRSLILLETPACEPCVALVIADGRRRFLACTLSGLTSRTATCSAGEFLSQVDDYVCVWERPSSRQRKSVLGPPPVGHPWARGGNTCAFPLPSKVVEGGGEWGHCGL